MWDVFFVEVNVSTGEETLTQKDIKAIAPMTMDKAELIIPARTLEYGIYKLVFNSRMWDDSIADPNWTRKLPFFNSAATYIKIKKSPLKGMMVKGGVSFITRGVGQSVTLEPYLYAEDPDYPDETYNGMEFRWYCRQTSETLPTVTVDGEEILQYDSKSLGLNKSNHNTTLCDVSNM